jgi:hypothetical protein
MNPTTRIHTSTSGSGCAPDGHWNSGNIPAGDSFKVVLSLTGIYPYYCIPHCDMGMTGTITVNPLGVQDTMAALPAPGTRLDNRPNPFTPYTLVDYQVEKPGNTTVKIYNETGQLVKILVEGYKARGNYSLLWDGRNTRGESVPAGVYFYRLVTGTTVLNKKMIRLR